MANIDPLSVVPLHVECFCRGATAGCSATGFVVGHKGRHHLITNWHVVTGRHPETNQPIDSKTGVADPDVIRVWHHDATRLGVWRMKDEELRDPGTGTPRWLEHPAGRAIDVI